MVRLLVGKLFKWKWSGEKGACTVSEVWLFSFINGFFNCTYTYTHKFVMVVFVASFMYSWLVVWLKKANGSLLDPL